MLVYIPFPNVEPDTISLPSTSNMSQDVQGTETSVEPGGYIFIWKLFHIFNARSAFLEFCYIIF